MTNDFLAPCRFINRLKLVEFFLAKVQTFPANVFVIRRPPDRRLFSLSASVNAVHNPLEHAHVLAVSGPKEFPIFSFAKPIHVEDSRRHAQCPLHLDPITEIVPHVITAEW